MTFSLLGRCPSTGQVGAAVTTSDIAVGARVPHGAPGLAIAVTQHRTDPRLGPEMLRRLRAGESVEDAVRETAAATEHRDWRQLALLGAGSGAAFFHGAKLTPIAGARLGEDCLAIGNMLSTDDVLPAMTDSFAASAGALAGRLIEGLRAGLRAGGETGVLRSAAVLVLGAPSFAVVDLRVDAGDDPLPALARLWGEYEPVSELMVRRALDPDGVDAHSSTTR